jgi:hypothetical protein
MTNWGLKIFDFLTARRRAANDDEFESVEPLPPDRVHSVELLKAVGVKPTRSNYIRLRKVMTRLGWMPAPNISIHGAQGKGYVVR